MRIFLLLLACTLLLPPLFSHARQTETITLVADQWCPYNCTPGSGAEGYILDVARSIYSEAGIEVRYVLLPWTRALHEVARGRQTAVIAATRGEAPYLVFPQEECGASDNGFFIRAQSTWKYEGTHTLARMRTAVIRDYDYGGSIREYIQNNLGTSRIHLGIESDALTRNFRLLERGRVDLLVEDVNVGKYMIKTLGLEDAVRFAGSEGRFLSVYVAFSPLHPRARELADMFSNGLARLRQSGELDRILARYGLTDWK